MAEIYKGLTIRIGADVSKLASAMKAANSAVRSTQSELRKLKSAIALDPGNKNVAAKYVGEIQSQAVAASSRIDHLKQEIEDLSKMGSKSVKGTTIGELAEGTDDAILDAARAKAAFASTTEELAKMYTKLTALSKEFRGKKEGKTFNATHSEMKDIIAEYTAIAGSGKNLISSSEANDDIAHIQRLKNTLEDMQNVLEDAYKVESIHKFSNEIATLEVTVKSLNGEISKTGKSTIAEGFGEIDDKLNGINDAARRVGENYGLLKERLRLDPTNIELAEQATEELAKQTALAGANVTGLQQKLQKYKDAGIDKLSDGMGDTQTETAKAVQSLSEANAEVIKLRSAIDLTNNAIQTMKSMDATNDDEYARLEQQVKDYRVQLEQATAAQEEAKRNLDTVLAVGEYRDLTLEVGKAENKFLNLNEELKHIVPNAEAAKEKVAEAARKQAEAAEKAAKAERKQAEEAARAAVKVETLTAALPKESSFSAIRGTTSALEALRNKAAQSEERFRSLNQLVKLDPKNLSLVRDRAEALAKATADAEKYSEALGEEIAAYKDAGFDKVASDAKSLGLAADEAQRNYERAEQSVKELTQSLTEAKVRAKTLENLGDTTSDEYKEAASEVSRLEDELSEAVTTMNKASSAFDMTLGANELRKLEGAADKAKLGIINMADTAKAKTATLTESLGLLAQQVGEYAREALRYVTRETLELDDAITNVKKTVDTTEEGYEALRQAAIDSSRVQPVDAATLLNIEALGGQLGFAAGEVEEFARVASGLDISTNMEWEDAATNMAQFANIMQMSHGDVDKYGAAIVELGNNFATTESDISDMALRIAGAGASLGMSEADVLGLSAALTSMGLTAEAGGSSISRIMTNIDKSVGHGFDGVKLYAEQAGLSMSDFLAKVTEGGDWAKEFAEKNEMTLDKLVSETKDSYDSLEVWADTAGYKTVDEFAAAWKDPQRGPIKVLEDVFSGMEKSVEDGSNLAILLDDLGVSTIRTQDVARRLASNSKLLSEAVESSNAAWKENTALMTEVERRNESLSGKVDVLRNVVTGFATEMGEGLVPIVEVATTVLKPLADIFDKVSTSIKAGVIVAGGLLAGVTVLNPIITLLHKNLLSIGAGIVTVVSKSALLTEGVLTAGIALEALGSGSIAAGAAIVAGVVAGLGLLAWTIHDAYSQYNEAQKKQQDFNEALGRLDGIAVSASDAVDKYKSGTKTLPQYLKEAATRTEELTKRLNEYADAVNELDQNSNDEVLQLQLYQDTLDELAGRQDLDAEQKAMLQWALDGINESLGTNITLEEAMAGNYKNEEGEIEGVTEALDALITKRQEEARLKANEDTYTKALELNNEMQSAYRDSQEALTEYVDAMREQAKAQGLYTNEEEFLAMLEKGSADYRELKANAENAGEAAKKASEEVTEASNLMANDQSWSEFGFDVGDVRQKMEELGLSSEDLATITVADFRKMAKGAGGNIDTLMQNIIDYNRLKMEGKNPTIDANGNVISGEAQRQLELTQKRIDTLSGKDVTARVTGNAVDGTAASAILDTVKAIAQLTASSAVAYVKAVVGGSFESGALRYHADGFIANNYGKGVAISSHDIVGENGAEAIIPLTNKRYTRPFADTVAEQMLDRMGNMQQGGDTYIIEKLEVPAGSALADAMSTVFDMALREAKA